MKNDAIWLIGCGNMAGAMLRGWLDLPSMPMPGGWSDVPRIQRPDYGASQRLVVMPGREGRGLFHMPGGQGGHPLSPHYRDGHDAWVRGDPAPLLPGPTVATLQLVPEAAAAPRGRDR